MTCQNLQNKLLNITVLFIWYLLQIVGEFKKNVTRQTWQALFLEASRGTIFKPAELHALWIISIYIGSTLAAIM
jgi:hypothetical protein